VTALRVLDELESSSWVRAESGLLETAHELLQDLGNERATVERHAARLARPGPLPPLRAARHLASLTAARWRWQYTRLPFDVLAGRPFDDLSGYLKATVAHLLRDHLAGLGAPAAEIARIVGGSEGLLPAVVVDEIRRRPVTVAPMSRVTVEAIVTRAFGDAVGAIEDAPFSATALGQLHRAKLAADGRSVLVCVRRPGVDGALRADARITATMVGPLEALVPQLWDECIELALAAEALDLDGLVIPRPIPGLVNRRAVVFEDLGGAPLDESSFDADRVLRSYLGITIESALTNGVFHADLRPEHLVIVPDGRLSVVGFGALGRFDIDIRRGALKYLTSVFSGDVDAQIEAMRMTGAVPDGVDVEALARDLSASSALQPMQMLTGGEGAIVAGLKEAVRLLLRHRLRPPLEVTLFVRNVFALNAFVKSLGGNVTLMSALMPLVQRLPQLNAELG
jgi:ubiquinone biosynthesis protein